MLRGVDDDTELDEFLASYAEACAEAGVEPLSDNELAYLAVAMLSGELFVPLVLH